MQNNCNFFNINPLENMLINIQEEGKEIVWKEIERIENPFKRCEQRKLFALAIQKIERIK